ncbi:hypothetical protein BV378_22935 [Nostoc sp. RF31YmG]|nr:hypothetical protein BV378_22935 [Nostoc sp. RF31YmG]
MFKKNQGNPSGATSNVKKSLKLIELTQVDFEELSDEQSKAVVGEGNNVPQVIATKTFSLNSIAWPPGPY